MKRRLDAKIGDLHIHTDWNLCMFRRQIHTKIDFRGVEMTLAMYPRLSLLACLHQRPN